MITELILHTQRNKLKMALQLEASKCGMFLDVFSD